MKLARTILAVTAVGLSAGTALAFQEQGGKAPAEAVPAGAPRSGVSAPNAPMPRTGPEIRIPGLGAVGNLPKFDFGLELLYGAAEPRGPREELNKSDPADLQIRGTIKYKFGN